MATELYALVSPGGQIKEYKHSAATLVLADLHPHKDRWLPIKEVFAPVNPNSQVRLDPVETVEANRVVRTYGARSKTAEEKAEMRLAKVGEVKAEAERRILAIMPEYKQRNAMAFGIEMITAHGPDPAGWPEEAQAVYQASLGAWEPIKAIRAKSNEIEALIPNTFSGIAEFDVMAADWD